MYSVTFIWDMCGTDEWHKKHNFTLLFEDGEKALVIKSGPLFYRIKLSEQILSIIYYKNKKFMESYYLPIMEVFEEGNIYMIKLKYIITRKKPSERIIQIKSITKL